VRWVEEFPEREALEARLLAPGSPQTLDERLQRLVNLLHLRDEIRAAFGRHGPDPEHERLEQEGNDRLIAWSRWRRERGRRTP
jgi:hypothetical protein